MRIRSMTAAAMLLTTGSVFAGNGLFDDDCRYTAPRRVVTPAAGVSRVVIHADAGSLEVDGTAGATQIVAAGTACTSDESFLPRITLTMRKSGSDLHITSEIPEKKVIFGFFSARLDLGVSIPAGLPVVIDDGSGWIRISNTGATTIDDDSGAVEARNIRGDLTIRDDSGSIDVDSVTGNVSIEDDSGEITVKNVGGNVDVQDDSGAITIARVEGSVRVREDDSGSIVVQNVRRDVTIDDDGSGAVDVADIGGNFTVVRKTSGGVEHSRVAGRVRIPEDR